MQARWVSHSIQHITIMYRMTIINILDMMVIMTIDEGRR